jgi:hypothetical protein
LRQEGIRQKVPFLTVSLPETFLDISENLSGFRAHTCQAPGSARLFRTMGGMPNPWDALVFEDTFTESDWLESIRDVRAGMLAPDQAAETITICCPFPKMKAACAFILGYSYTDTAGYLRRELPIFHPVWTWLYAVRIGSIRLEKFKNKDQALWDGSLPFAVYEWAHITIDFAQLTYPIFSDSELETDPNTSKPAEYQRWCETLTAPYTELVQINGGQMKRVRGNQNYIGSPYVLAFQAKTKIKLIWYQVPSDFLANDDGIKSNLLAIQKTINATPFLGYPAGTLFCEQAIDYKGLSPIATDVMGEKFYQYKVEVDLIHFDPPVGPGEPSAGGTGTPGTYPARGWNLLPGGQKDRYYYEYVSETDSNHLFFATEFANLFTKAQ